MHYDFPEFLFRAEVIQTDNRANFHLQSIGMFWMKEMNHVFISQEAKIVWKSRTKPQNRSGRFIQDAY
jgi:hypothetical protein